MKEEETVELSLSDAFGNKQYVYALSKKKIIEKIEEVEENLYKYVKEAWENHVPGAVDTVAVLDLTTGEVDYANYSPNWDPIFDPSITLFSISHRTRANTDWRDIYDDEEFEEAREMRYNDEIEDYEEYAEIKGIDLADRFATYLEPFIADVEFGEYYEELMEKLDRIYENEIKS